MGILEGLLDGLSFLLENLGLFLRQFNVCVFDDIEINDDFSMALGILDNFIDLNLCYDFTFAWLGCFIIWWVVRMVLRVVQAV